MPLGVILSLVLLSSLTTLNPFEIFGDLPETLGETIPLPITVDELNPLGLSRNPSTTIPSDTSSAFSLCSRRPLGLSMQNQVEMQDVSDYQEDCNTQEHGAGILVIPTVTFHHLSPTSETVVSCPPSKQPPGLSPSSYKSSMSIISLCPSVTYKQHNRGKMLLCSDRAPSLLSPDSSSNAAPYLGQSPSSIDSVPLAILSPLTLLDGDEDDQSEDPWYVSAKVPINY
ncbi:hypothetical protein NE237_026255 [Protea cynaroides]|uniref:Uncharacterized protein n=1 Tax=Protea cynaroides TaxID=273540 RepID=A0A9Q0H4N5_9MAGN|nr:hypothetical protein NE237_026255 [Protea cynaroides]